jgi:hypothetical protein
MLQCRSTAELKDFSQLAFFSPLSLERRERMKHRFERKGKKGKGGRLREVIRWGKKSRRGIDGRKDYHDGAERRGEQGKRKKGEKGT